MHLLATLVIAVVSTVVNQGIASVITPSLNRSSPTHRIKVQVHQGKLNFTTMSDIPEGASVLTGTFSINDTPIKILFDSGATHSFISENLLGKMGLKGSHTTFSYKIITLEGKSPLVS
jgi:predicted aspartyl protease